MRVRLLGSLCGPASGSQEAGVAVPYEHQRPVWCAVRAGSAVDFWRGQAASTTYAVLPEVCCVNLLQTRYIGWFRAPPNRSVELREHPLSFSQPCIDFHETTKVNCQVQLRFLHLTLPFTYDVSSIALHQCLFDVIAGFKIIV